LFTALLQEALNLCHLRWEDGTGTDHQPNNHCRPPFHGFHQYRLTAAKKLSRQRQKSLTQFLREAFLESRK
jgi:hypothetical protein